MINRPMYINKLMPYVDTPFVKNLTGVRRCGKPTIFKRMMEKLRERGVPEERIVSYGFDSMEYEGMTAKQMYAEMKARLSPSSKTYLFFDEVQEIQNNYPPKWIPKGSKRKNHKPRFNPGLWLSV